MERRGMRAWMANTTARLSALYLLLFTLCAVLLVFYMTTLATRFLAGQTRDAISADATVLEQVYTRGGIPALVQLIERRSRQPGANLYVIADPAGRILAGNVAEVEEGVLTREGWTSRPFDYVRFGVVPSRDRQSADSESEERRTKAVAWVTRLPNGLMFLVGRDLGEPERLQFVVRRALSFALALMALGGFLIWYFVGRRAMVRLDAISDAGQRIMAGDLTQRLPVTGAGDEFDRLADNLNTMLNRIYELNDGLRQVSANIAHDLKTPLTRLRSRAEAALAGKKTKDELRAALEQTIAESDNLIRTFNAILMISRLESGYSAETMTPVDLKATVADVMELYEPVAEDQGASIETLEMADVSVNGNRELIAQTISNVVDNALKHGSNGHGALRIAASLTRSGKEAVIEITDNGPGIPVADRERVTDRLVRLEESRSLPGSGLGLSLVKAVMKLHRGRLEFADAGPGLVVRLIFPLDANPQARGTR